jgi:hypothetical protein
MAFYTLVSWGSWIFNTTWQTCRRIRRVSLDLHNVITSDNAWIITPAGAFFDSTTFANATEGYWRYNNNLLINGDATGKPAKLPLLSCEFTYGEEKISMDEFLEEVRYIGPLPPLPVLMAAFTIHTKRVHPWGSANFVAFLRDGTDVNFPGTTSVVPTN